jgi:hypothetical protein
MGCTTRMKYELLEIKRHRSLWSAASDNQTMHDYFGHLILKTGVVTEYRIFDFRVRSHFFGLFFSFSYLCIFPIKNIY